MGYAEAALSAWRAAPPAQNPPDVLVMRAQLLQYRHHFHDALALLDAALAQDAGHVRALAWRAAVNMVLGRYDAVPSDCSRIRERGEGLLALRLAAHLGSALAA